MPSLTPDDLKAWQQRDAKNTREHCRVSKSDIQVFVNIEMLEVLGKVDGIPISPN